MEVNLYNTNKKYNVIYADPPWSYQQWCNKKQGAAKAHYETMKQKEVEESHDHSETFFKCKAYIKHGDIVLSGDERIFDYDFE